MKITNEFNLPKAFVDAVSKDYNYRDKRYSVTQVLNDPRYVLLTRRHNDEIVQDVSEMIWLIFGTAVHTILENAKEGALELKETPIEYHTRNGYTLSGRFDLYDMETGEVTDYKTGTVWKVIYNNVEDYKEQLKMYCVCLRQMGFKAERGQIVMILKDWSASKAKRELDYPKRPIATWRFKFSEMELDEAEERINEYFEELEKLEAISDDELPLCSVDQRTFGKKETYAIKKTGRKTALKVCQTLDDARALIDKVGGDWIETRPAEDTKCLEYCSCNKFCKYWKEKYGKN